jgi:hypothetical protein
MVATIFPVGADWTREATEDTVSQTIAANALSVLKNYYAPDSLNPNTRGQLATLLTSTTPYNVQGLPAFTFIPLAERTYQFGNTTPFPSPNPPSCTYYWTAVGRVSPAQPLTSATHSYDIYILVFRKGEAAQTFYNTQAGYVVPTTPVALTDMGAGLNPVRDTDESKFPTAAVDPHFANFKHYQEPTLVVSDYKHGTYNSSSSPAIPDCYPPLGFTGIGQTSGTVFRQLADVNNNQANAYPPLAGQTTATANPSEKVIYAPPADGTSASPLIYVYQTTLTY